MCPYFDYKGSESYPKWWKTMLAWHIYNWFFAHSANVHPIVLLPYPAWDSNTIFLIYFHNLNLRAQRNVLNFTYGKYFFLRVNL